MSIGFKPICDENSKVLILGEFPGRDSLDIRDATGLEAYYSNDTNCFWDIFDSKKQGWTNMNFQASIQAKTDYLHKHLIAVWDVIQECDMNCPVNKNNPGIRYNDIIGRIQSDMPNIDWILFNGKRLANDYETADPYLKALLNTYNDKIIKMPSTSHICNRWGGTQYYHERLIRNQALNATDYKIMQWQNVLNKLPCKPIP